MFEQADCHIKPSTLFGISSACAGAGGMPARSGRAADRRRCPVAAWCMFSRAVDVAVLTSGKRRLKKFAGQLPDALELVARALRAGHSLAAGLHVVAEEMPAPIADEFGRVYEEQNLGIPIEDALRGHVRPRAEPRPALLRHVGGHPAADRRRPGGDPRQDRLRHPRALPDPGPGQGADRRRPAVGIVLIALPFALFVFMLHIKPDYVESLWTDRWASR